jgi:hypothetical protein
MRFNAKTIIIIAIVGVAGYFLYKEMKINEAQQRINSNPAMRKQAEANASRMGTSTKAEVRKMASRIA